MFTSLGLFKKTRCPDIQNCKRTTCLFSHTPGAPHEPPPLMIPIDVPKPRPQVYKRNSNPNPEPFHTQTIPSKRSSSDIQTANGTPPIEPPRKLSKLGTTQKSITVATSSVSPIPNCILRCTPTPATLNVYSQSGVPVLKVRPAHSLVPIPVRQVSF